MNVMWLSPAITTRLLLLSKISSSTELQVTIAYGLKSGSSDPNHLCCDLSIGVQLQSPITLMRCIEYVRIPKRSFIAWLRRMRHLCKGRRRYYHPNTVAELINGTMVMTGYDGANIGMAAQNGHKLICVTQMTCGHRANRNGTMMEA